MRRTTISLPDHVADTLARTARRRNVSSSALAREALERYLDIGTSRRLPFAAVGSSVPSTTAREMEQLLESEWDAPTRDR